MGLSEDPVDPEINSDFVASGSDIGDNDDEIDGEDTEADDDDDDHDVIDDDGHDDDDE